MNKTVNINLGGMFFHIDEDAYQKLTRYFDAIKRSLSNSSGHDEIIKDIEMRVSELLTDKQKSDKHVIGLKDVDEVIAVMGQPEDYIIEDDLKEAQTNNNASNRKSKKLYRDKEKGMIGVKGYRTVGGIRVSMYNAMPMSSVEAFCALIKSFS